MIKVKPKDIYKLYLYNNNNMKNKEVVKKMEWMKTAERNRAIKKVLSKEFGYKNVSVRGGRGTGYGWVLVEINTNFEEELKRKTEEERKKVKMSEEYYKSFVREERRKKYSEIHKKVYQLIKSAGLWDEIGIWYDDRSEKHKEITIDII